jgi:hypothetical protein
MSKDDARGFFVQLDDRPIDSTTAGLRHVDNPADHAPVAGSRHAAHVRPQMQHEPPTPRIVQPIKFIPSWLSKRAAETRKAAPIWREPLRGSVGQVGAHGLASDELVL